MACHFDIWWTQFPGLFRPKTCKNKLADSTNKPKTTWSIIKTITNNKKNPNDLLMMENDGKVTTHHQTIAEVFNSYYVSVADNINNNNPVNNTIGDLNKNDLLNYLYSAFQQSFTNINLYHTRAPSVVRPFKIPWYEGTHHVALQPLKCTVHSCRGLEL